MLAIECSTLKKTYQPKGKAPVEALTGVSLQIEQGEIYGVLGQNGAGKTTLIQMLATQLLPTSGSAQVLGHDVVNDALSIRKRINVISGGEVGMYPWLTAIETLEYIGFLYKLPRKLVKDRARHLLQAVGLDPSAWQRPTMQLSKGMKQRVMIARGLMNDPSLIFLDEPTIGLDVQAVKDTRALISSWAAEGKTIILTSHNMGDIEQTCDRLCIIQKGRISIEKTVSDLKDKYKTRATLEVAGVWSQVEDHFKKIGHCYQVQQKELSFSVTMTLAEKDLGKLYGYFSGHADQLLSISVDKESLEDVYLSLLDEETA